MTKTLTAIGNSLGLIIERPILDLLKIERDTLLEITTDGKGLYIRPAESGHRDRVLEVAGRVMEIHEETLKKLAQ